MLLIPQHNNRIKSISVIDPLTAAIIFFTDIFNYGQAESMVEDIFFDVLWSNGQAGSLLFCMWTVRKPADIFDVTEINGASEPEALQLSIPLSSRLKNILLSSEEGILDFSGRRTS